MDFFYNNHIESNEITVLVDNLFLEPVQCTGSFKVLNILGTRFLKDLCLYLPVIFIRSSDQLEHLPLLNLPGTRSIEFLAPDEGRFI